MELKYVIMIAYVIGMCASVSQLAEFQGSQYKHRHNVKRAYVFCWAALVIPVLNIVGACYLLSLLRDAARRERDAWVNIRMTFPPHYDSDQQK